MRARALASIALMVAACGSAKKDNSPAADGTTVTVGAASLAIPSGWTPTLADTTNRQVFVPAKNDRKESISVRVVDRKGSTTIDDLLDNALDAERTLTGATVAEQHRFTTEDGVQGIWIDLTFVPENFETPYARTQVTLVTDTHIINIFYTAKNPDRAHAALQQALASFREEA